MAAGSLAGILGMILAIPVYTILRVIAKEFFDLSKELRIFPNLDIGSPIFADNSRNGKGLARGNQ